MEHISSHLFDLVAHTPFHKLNAAMQAEVLTYFTEQEYTALYQAAQQARAFHHATGITPDARTRETLLHAFDQKYPQQKARKSLALYPIHLWKAAAVVVFCMGITLWSYLRQSGHEEIRYVSIKDTVYMASANTAPAEKVYDTVYIRINPGTQTTARPRTKSSGQQVNSTKMTPEIPGHINILRLRDKDQPVNTSKGNSREDDTLLKKYPFVRL